MNRGKVSEAVAAAVKEMVDKGCSAGEIGIALHMSRSAVCGLCFRRKWTLKGKHGRIPGQSPHKQKPSVPRKRGPRGPRKSRATKQPVVAIAPVGFVKRKQIRPNTIPRCMWHNCKERASDYNKPYCYIHK